MITPEPSFDRSLGVMCSSASDTPAAIFIHPAHHNRLKYLDKRVMDVLIRPLYRFGYGSPFLCAYIVSLRYMRFFRNISFQDYPPQIFDPVFFCFFYPGSSCVRLMVCLPMMCFINFIDRFSQILIRDQLFEQITCSFQGNLNLLLAVRTFQRSFECTSPLPYCSSSPSGARNPVPCNKRFSILPNRRQPWFAFEFETLL